MILRSVIKNPHFPNRAIKQGRIPGTINKAESRAANSFQKNTLKTHTIQHKEGFVM
jgi:hypothetical protein